ncbi:MAG: hypothetical protein EOO65_02790 [Methanosarcinales archaeon]|nr:MAG: hypothetical protein EOO65_02790 [Methanosarcinales archaeon]
MRDALVRTLQLTSIGNGGEVTIKDSMREELFKWLAKHAACLPKTTTLTQPLAQPQFYRPVVDALQDKTPTVRRHAQEFLVHAIRIAGTSAVNTGALHSCTFFAHLRCNCTQA